MLCLRGAKRKNDTLTVSVSVSAVENRESRGGTAQWFYKVVLPGVIPEPNQDA